MEYRLTRSAAVGFIGAAAIVWLFLGVFKFMHTDDFAETLSGHGLIGQGWVATTAVAIASMELLLGIFGLAVLPLGHRLVSGAAALFSVVLAIFVIYATLLVIWPPEKPVSCGCFPGSAPTDNWAVIGGRAAVASLFMLLAAFACKSGPGNVKRSDSPA